MESRWTEGAGKAPEHRHPARTRAHDRYHVTHHHRGGPLMEFEHLALWHTHAHNHNTPPHSHDHSLEDEERDHGHVAHVHDRAEPTASPGK